MKDLNTLVSAVFLVSATVLTGGCRDDRKQDDHRSGYDANQPVSFITSADETRGTPISNASELTSMGVFCAATGFNDWTSGAALNKMYNRYLVQNAGKWEYVGEDVYWGANSFDERYTFFGYAPSDSPGADGKPANGIRVNGAEGNAGIPTLTYTVPDDVTLQPDLMVAVPQYNRRPSGKPVELNMRHALTCVGFQIAGDGEKITAISVKGVSQEGTLTMDGGDIRWSNLSTPSTEKDFSASINYDAGQNFFTAQADMSAGLIAGNGYLMMIPQTLGQNAAITVTMDDNTVKEIPLSGSEWLAGKKTSYHITFTPAGTITVAPGSVMLPFLNSSDKIQVFCTKNNGAPNPAARWTLTSSASWLTLSLNPDGNGAAASVSGAGTQLVYIFAEENHYQSDRRATISLAGEVAVNVTQMKYIAIPEGAGDPPANTDTYTGAFWKHDETGERLIRINVGAAGNNNHGLWQVAAIWCDQNWTGADDGIVFSPDDSSDPYIYTDDPDDAENYQVKDGTSFLSGDVGANGTISFRIGLQKKFPAYDETYNPARYAVLVLSYNNYEKHQRIYIRQGEGADYLMRNDDPVETGGITKRTQCVKFSPYNLTADVLNAEVPKRGGKFADFPTQAGAFFQWNNTYTDEFRHAWDPFTKNMVTWSGGYSKNTFWNTLADEHETCPYGYRRPNDGSITGNEANINISGSEIRQSLMLRPTTGQTPSSLDNTIWGFYADGFFDRRAKYYKDETIYVANGTRDVAYAGRLFYNPYSNATIFFPVAGSRFFEDGQLVLKNGVYWSSTAASTEYAWAVAIYNTITVIVRSNKSSGACIRCVADE